MSDGIRYNLIDSLHEQLAQCKQNVQEQKERCDIIKRNAACIEDDLNAQIVVLRGALQSMLDRFGIMSNGCIKQAHNALELTEEGYADLIVCDCTPMLYLDKDHCIVFPDDLEGQHVPPQFEPLFRKVS